MGVSVTVRLPPGIPAVERGFLRMGPSLGRAGSLVVTSRYLELDGRPWLPVMGEFHYSRYPDDSHWSLALVYTGYLAQYVWLIKGYYDSVPREIEEAAAVDGATPLQAFVHVLLPMALPILVVVFVIAFLWAMVEYPVASVLLRAEDKLTLAIASRLFLFNQRYLWGDFAATAILAGIPLTALCLVTQRWLVSGLRSGAVKG